MAVGHGVDQLISSAAALGSKTVDLNRKDLTEIPPGILDLQQLEFLYLEGNYLTTLPESLFERLPNLKWLDLRNNHIAEVPGDVGTHKCLKNLLLEGNNIRSLPLELGFIKSLSGLNLASNPLELPPPQVIEKGTQEVLRYLRDQFMERSHGQDSQVRPLTPSSSEEELAYNKDYTRAIVREEHKIEPENEPKRIEKVPRLPPIFQAAAARPRTRTVENTENLLQGQRAKQFEHEKHSAVIVSEPDPCKSPKRQRGDAIAQRSVMISPKKELMEMSDSKDKQKIIKVKIVDNLRQSLVSQNTEAEKVDRQRKRLKSRGHSPNKEPKPKKRLDEKPQVNYEMYKPHHLEREVQTVDVEGRREVLEKMMEITSKTNQMTVNENTSVGNLDEKVKQHYSDLRDLAEASQPGTRINLREGDMIAIKVPDKLYIKGQPCLGKIATLPNSLGQLTVHYYTGTYDGHWRPMMSRTSPYLRKVPLTSVLCKFKVSSDGRMSPITAAKIKKAVDSERKERI